MTGKLTKSAKQCEMLKNHGEEGTTPPHHHFTFLNKISQSLPTKEGKFSDVIDVIDATTIPRSQANPSFLHLNSSQANIIFLKLKKSSYRRKNLDRAKKIR